ncbi:MAG: hypothetical protein IJ694_09575 [Acidaminococcaceae bacterium]|nr:hypothetical protein [Acidaminococcaceae bacterium]
MTEKRAIDDCAAVFRVMKVQLSEKISSGFCTFFMAVFHLNLLIQPGVNTNSFLLNEVVQMKL